MVSELGRICDFLWYGFCPSIEKAKDRFAELRALASDNAVRTFSPDAVESAGTLLVDIVVDKLNGATEVIIPISAGYDSRGLLGAALKILPSDAITLYTVGHEGADDFDRTRSFTKGVVKKHHFIDITTRDDQGWDTGSLVAEVTRRGTIISVPETGKAIAAMAPHGPSPGAPQLNGFLGDTLSGKRLPNPISKSWREAVQRFASRNRAYKGAFPLTPPDYRPEETLPDVPFPDSVAFTFDDQLDWCFRQEQRIRVTVGAQPDRSAGSVGHPYDDKRWWRSWMQIALRHRVDQKLYKRILASQFPAIFPDLATSAPRRSLWEMVGVKRPQDRRAAKMHVDLDHLFRSHAGFRRFCTENIEDLEKREATPWLDLSQILDQARRDAAGMGRPLFALASLEINFKAGHLESSGRTSG